MGGSSAFGGSPFGGSMGGMDSIRGYAQKNIGVGGGHGGAGEASKIPLVVTLAVPVPLAWNECNNFFLAKARNPNIPALFYDAQEGE